MLLLLLPTPCLLRIGTGHHHPCHGHTPATDFNDGKMKEYYTRFQSKKVGGGVRLGGQFCYERLDG
jgi:hypothetical protein